MPDKPSEIGNAPPGRAAYGCRQCLIVDFAQHRRLHEIVEDLRRCAAERFKARNMAVQNGLQVLMRHEAALHHAAVAETIEKSQMIRSAPG